MINHIATCPTMTETSRTSLGLPLLISLAAAACAAGCGSFGANSAEGSRINPVNWITPFRVDVIQGNFVSKEQVAALKAGMTRAQVTDMLGTPLLSSLFHQDRWDYVFTLKRQGVEPQAFKYTVFFKGDQLERFAGDAMPSEAEFIATLASARKFGKQPVLEATDAQLRAAEKAPSVKAAAADAAKTPADVPAPASIYPPLESAKQ